MRLRRRRTPNRRSAAVAALRSPPTFGGGGALLRRRLSRLRTAGSVWAAGPQFRGPAPAVTDRPTDRQSEGRE